MLKIERHYNRYRIQSKERTPGFRPFDVNAGTIAEVLLAVEHYFGRYTTPEHDREHCPLCKDEAAA